MYMSVAMCKYVYECICGCVSPHTFNHMIYIYVWAAQSLIKDKGSFPLQV